VAAKNKGINHFGRKLACNPNLFIVLILIKSIAIIGEIMQKIDIEAIKASNHKKTCIK
jgi:hypothetical protein